MPSSSDSPTQPYPPEAVKTERPVRIGEDPSPFDVQSYMFRGCELRVVTLMVPLVLDWLTKAFGTPCKQDPWTYCLLYVTTQGRSTFAGSQHIDPLGVLQLCLMRTPPFRDAEDKHVWDLRYDPAKAIPCPNWERLIEALATALYTYLVAPFLWLQEAEWFAAQDQDLLRRLHDFIGVYELLRSRGLLNTHHAQTSPDKPAFHKQAGITETYQTMKGIVEHVTQDLDFEQYLRARGSFEERFKIDLSLEMCRAFQAAFHGNKIPYRLVAILRSVAAILSELDLEQGPLDTLITRIASRRRPERRGQS